MMAFIGANGAEERLLSIAGDIMLITQLSTPHFVIIVQAGDC